MTLEGDSGPLTAWFSPDPRAVLSWPGMRVSRSLRRSMRRFDITYDLAFDQVLEGCADPSRPHGWITPDYPNRLSGVVRGGPCAFGRGVAGGEIGGDVVGGLMGVELGGLFCADSMFRRVTDASKAAVAGLSARIFDETEPNGRRRLIDAQWLTGHLASLGFGPAPRDDYLSGLPVLVSRPAAFGAPGSPGSGSAARVRQRRRDRSAAGSRRACRTMPGRQSEPPGRRPVSTSPPPASGSDAAQRPRAMMGAGQRAPAGRGSQPASARRSEINPGSVSVSGARSIPAAGVRGGDAHIAAGQRADRCQDVAGRAR